MVFAYLGESGAGDRGHFCGAEGWLAPVGIGPEVVVVHPNRGEDVEPELVAACDQCEVGVFAALPHGVQGHGAMQVFHAAEAVVLGIAEVWQSLRWPGRLVGSDAPEERSDLSLCERSVDYIEELVQALGGGGVAARSAVPVENDSVGGGAFSHDRG